MRLDAEALFQLRGDARLADSGFAGDQHNLAVACLGARPTPQQQVDLLVAADQGHQRRSVQSLEAACDGTRTQYLPCRHRRGDALQFDGAEIAVLEQMRRPAGVCSQRSRQYSGSANACRRAARLGVSPTTVCSCADPAPIRSPTTTSPVAIPTRACSFAGFDIEAADRVDCAQPCSHRPLGVVLMRLRIAEIDQHAVAHVPGNEAVEPRDHLGDRTMICRDHLTQILGVQPRREWGRADQVAEHHGQLPALGVGWRRCVLSPCRPAHRGGARRSRRAIGGDAPPNRRRDPSDLRPSGSAIPSHRSRWRGTQARIVRDPVSAATPQCPSPTPAPSCGQS